MTNARYWSNYYKGKSPEEIPWNHTGGKLFNFLFKKYDVPKEGNVLDVGTGTGKKAIALKEMGFDVWAFDVTDEAFEEAKKNNSDIHFFISDAVELDSTDEIKDVSFDIIFDLLVTQFLLKEEKKVYLKRLSSHLNKGSYYILQTFYKDKDIKASKIPWVNKVSQSKKEIEEVYGEYFEIIDISIKEGKKGTDAVVVMKRK